MVSLEAQFYGTSAPKIFLELFRKFLVIHEKPQYFGHKRQIFKLDFDFLKSQRISLMVEKMQFYTGNIAA